MGTPQSQPGLTEFKAQLKDAMNQIVVFASDLGSANPPDLAKAKATLARILQPLLGDASGAADANDSAASGNNADEPSFNADTDLSEGLKRKRAGRPVHHSFQAPTTKSIHAPGSWPSDMSAGKRDATIKKALGKHAPKGR